MKVIKINYTILYPEMSFEMVFVGFLDLKTVLPATKTLAPNSNNFFDFLLQFLYPLILEFLKNQSLLDSN